MYEYENLSWKVDFMTVVAHLGMDMLLIDWVFNSIEFRFNIYNILPILTQIGLFALQAFVISPYFFGFYGSDEFGYMFAGLCVFMFQGTQLFLGVLSNNIKRLIKVFLK